MDETSGAAGRSSGAHYFLTGGTGVVGSAFMKHVAARGERITLLLRARTPAAAHARLERLLAACGWASGAVHRIDAVAGDLQLPRLGLCEAAYARIAADCTHLAHCAGNVRMNLPLAVARNETLAMTRGMLALLDDASERASMTFVSTVGVAGHLTGEVPEAWIQHRNGHRNTYEAAKAEAEQLVRGRIAAGRAVTVIRPSMVVGDSRTGAAPSFQVFYHLCEFLSGARTMGWIPRVGDMQLDIVPCDYVASVLDWSLQHPRSPAPILHACAGPQGALALTTLIRRARCLFAAHGRPLPVVKPVPLPLYRWLLRLSRPLVSPAQRRALDALPFFFAYLKERQWFSNTRTLALLAADGIAPPVVDDYLEKILAYYLAARRSRRE